MTVLDARKAERLSLTLPVSYTIDLPHQQLNGIARTINVSGGGIQLSVSSSVAPQTPCQIVLTLPDRDAPLMLHGQISWCRPAGRSRAAASRIGIAFATPRMPEENGFASYCQFIATQLFTKYFRGSRDVHARPRALRGRSVVPSSR